MRANQRVKYNVPKNCSVGGSNFDSDSNSSVDRKLWWQYFSSILRIARHIHHRRFFPKQEEKMASIEQVIEATIQAVLAGIITLMPKHRYDRMFHLVWIKIFISEPNHVF